MRKEFSKKIEEILFTNQKSVFITGDLGFNAFERIQEVAADRFINAGVAEQNMVGVAAGLAYKGFETFTYSIAPFAVYRCFEQIKIDVCMHDLPVYIVGNGGGYGYGIMGATHHAIEDIGCLSMLPNMTCWVPAFLEDVDYCLDQMISRKKPAYLRLGLGKSYPDSHIISDINFIRKGENRKITVIALGPIVHNVLEAIAGLENIDLFTIIRIPIFELDENLIKSMTETKKVIVIEEHVERGGLGEHILAKISKKRIRLDAFVNLHAKGYPSSKYGDQLFHQTESGLDPENIKKEISILFEN